MFLRETTLWKNNRNDEFSRSGHVIEKKTFFAGSITCFPVTRIFLYISICTVSAKSARRTSICMLYFDGIDPRRLSVYLRPVASSQTRSFIPRSNYKNDIVAYRIEWSSGGRNYSRLRSPSNRFVLTRSESCFVATAGDEAGRRGDWKPN